jgi:copper chaperone
MANIIISVDGMECDACTSHIKKALEALPGVADARVSLLEKQADVRYDPDVTDVEAMRRAIEEEGYSAL